MRASGRGKLACYCTTLHASCEAEGAFTLRRQASSFTAEIYMAIPDFQAVMLPLLYLASDGQERSMRSAIETLGREFAPPPLCAC